LIIYLLVLTAFPPVGSSKPRIFFGGHFDICYGGPSGGTFYGVSIWDDENGLWKNMTGGLKDRTITANDTISLYKNDQIYASYYDDSSSLLYIGGQFTEIGNLVSPSVVAYNLDNSWKSLSSSCNGKVLAVSGTNETIHAIFIGGDFTTINSINTGGLAMLNPATGIWSVVGDIVNGVVNAIIINNSTVYIGGSFTSIGSVSYGGFAAFDLKTQNWLAVGAGVCSGEIKSFAIVKNYLFVAGTFTSFTTATSPTCPGIDGIQLAQYDMKTHAFTENLVFSNTSLIVTVNVLATTVKEELFLGGSFSKILSYNLDRFALYNLTHWYSVVSSSAGIPFTGPVTAVAATSNGVFVGGQFMGTGTPYSGVARISSIGTINNLLSGLSCGTICDVVKGNIHISTVFTVSVLPPGPPTNTPPPTGGTSPFGGLIGSGGKWEEYNITSFPGSSVYFQNDTNYKYSQLSTSRPHSFYWQTWSVIGSVIFIGSLFFATLLNLCVRSVTRVY